MVEVHTRPPKGKMRISSRCIALLLGILLTLGLFFNNGRLEGLRLLAAGDSSDPPREIQFESYETENTSLDEETIEAPCSLRQAVRRNQHLCKLFNFSVPVLQWAGSSSKAAWERLPPYGWRGLPENVVRSTLGLLRVPQLFRRPSPGACIRCAVVGNGGILQGSGQGKEIDSHDFVFRVNGAVIKGFEKDVGTKISFYGFTTNTLKNSLRAYRRNGFTEIPQNPDIKYIFIPSNIRDYVMIAAAIHGQTVGSGHDKGDRPLKYFGHKPPKSFKFLHPDFISYVTRSFLFSPLMANIKTRHLYMPSTGALMLLTALHTCDEVSAYGFITRNYTAFSDHYYDAVKKPLQFFANHDMRMESRLWEALHLQGVLKLYQRS